MTILGVLPRSMQSRWITPYETFISISVYKHLDIHHIAQFLVSKYQNPFDHNNITRFDMNSFLSLEQVIKS